MDAVQFTRESAERIGRVVRSAEQAVQPASPLTFEPWFGERTPRNVRAARFSGAWSIGSSKVVSFKYSPTGTANVTNLSWPLSSTAYLNEDCLVGREGTNWWLVVPVLQTATAVIVTQTAAAIFISGTASANVVTSTLTQNVVTGVSTTGGTINYLTDVSVSATLSTNDCSINVSVSKTTGSSSIVTGINASTASVTVCGGVSAISIPTATSTGAYIVRSSTAAFLRPRVP